MIVLELTAQECLQFPNILPGLGSIKTLTQVNNILNTVKIDPGQETKTCEFAEEDLMIAYDMIMTLDKSNKLHIDSLSLVNKILANIKEK